MGEALPNSNRSATNQAIRLCLLLASVLLVAFPLIAYVGNVQYGHAGFVAAIVAAAVCLVAGCIAIGVTSLFQSMGNGLNGLLLSILIRTGIPLIAGVTLSAQGGPLAEGGVFGMIVLNYLLMLTIETISAVRIVQAMNPCLLYTSPSPRDQRGSRMPSSA